MADYSELVKRLRGVNWICHIYGKTEVLHDTVCHEAAYAIEAQAKRIEELEKRVKSLEEEEQEWLYTQLEERNDRIAELRAALKPFAEITEQQNFKDYQYNQDDCVMTAGVWGFKPDFTFKLGDLRAARKVLGEKE